MWKEEENVVGEWIRKNIGKKGMVMDEKESD